MDDLSKVRRAAFGASDFHQFQQRLLEEENEKRNEAQKAPNSLKPEQVAIVHSITCHFSKEPVAPMPCTCGASRKYRQGRAEMIEAHLDSAGTMSHRNALELRDHWSAAEAELTDALEQIEKLAARMNLAAETEGFNPEAYK